MSLVEVIKRQPIEALMLLMLLLLIHVLMALFAGNVECVEWVPGDDMRQCLCYKGEPCDPNAVD